MFSTLLLIIVPLGSSATIGQVNPVEDRLIQRLKSFRIEKFYYNCLYVSDKSSIAKLAMASFIPNQQCPVVIATTYHKKKNMATVMFIQSDTSLIQLINTTKSYEWYTARSDHYVVLCSGGPETVARTSRLIWQERILNFLVITVDTIVTYNPFLDQLSTLTRPIFGDKLANLHGYRLRVSLFKDFPLVLKNHNGDWICKDWELLMIVVKMINATVEVIETTHFKGAHDDMASGVVDFSFNGHFVSPLRESEFSYPNHFNDLVLLIPVSKSDYYDKETIYNIYEPLIMILWGLSALIVSLMLRLEGASRVLEGALSIVLGIPIATRIGSNLRLIVLNVVIMSMIVRVGFQACLICSFSDPFTYDRISSLAQFKAESRLPVFISNTLAGIMPKEPLNEMNHLKIVPVDTVNDLVLKWPGRGVHLITTRQAFAYMELMQDCHEDYYYVLNDAVVPGYDSYSFRKHSPYLDKFNECLLREFQFSLTKFTRYHNASQWLKEKTRTRGGDEGGGDGANIVLGLRHLYNVFVMLVAGWGISLGVFLGEIALYYLK